MISIWPERVIALPSSSSMSSHSEWLTDDKVVQVLEVVAPGHRIILDSPVILDGNSTQKLIALAVLGEDGFGSGTLMLRVINERAPEMSALILSVVSYSRMSGPDRGRLKPGQVGDMLDKLVTDLKAIPGLALVGRER